MIDKVAHIRRAQMKLREVLDRDPTDAELSNELKLNPRQVREYRQASKTPVSLDAPVGGDESSRISEIVADQNAVSQFDHLAAESDVDLLREVLVTLADRESAILAMRFGLDNGTPKTLEEVGAHFGVTRERVRQIQDQALKKIAGEDGKRDRPANKEKSRWRLRRERLCSQIFGSFRDGLKFM